MIFTNQLFETFEHLECFGISHRDIKLANFLYKKDNKYLTLKIGDLSESKQKKFNEPSMR